MDDLTMVRACAEAMGLTHEWDTEAVYLGIGNRMMPSVRYDPLHDDAQAMALVKRFRIGLSPPTVDDGIWAAMADGGGAIGDTLNRAIVECVAKIQTAKESNDAN